MDQEDRWADLMDGGAFHSKIVIRGSDQGELTRWLDSMIRIRTAEQLLAAKRSQGLIGGPVHLGVGQEAIAVGVSDGLHTTDAVFGAHRSHSHLLALGSPVHRLFAEVLGRETGASHGMGGSMHLWDGSVGFFGSVPIVAGTVPLAVGAGLAARMRGTGDVAVAYLGDAAVEEGIVHESLNLASVTNARVLFVVENNLFASHMHISQRQSGAFTARFAKANGMPYDVVDGNDVVAVARSTQALIDKIREDDGPAFLEAITYRWYGHVDWREDIDVGVNRSEEDLRNWRNRDPVRRLEEAMVSADLWTGQEGARLREKIALEAERAWAQAMNDPYPPDSALLDCVYAK